MIILHKQKKYTRTYVERMVDIMMKKAIATITCTAILIGLTACTNAKSDSDKNKSKTKSEEAIVYDSGQNIANPFTKVNSLAEAIKMAGFDMSIPDAPTEYPDTLIQVSDDNMDGHMNGHMIEVIYSDDAKKTDAGTDEGYRIRKAAGNEDISGDYTEYPVSKTETIDGRQVTMKGQDDNISVATWTSDGYSYAIDAADHPLTLEAVTSIISSIK